MDDTLQVLRTRNLAPEAAVRVSKARLRERAVMLGLDEYVAAADEAAARVEDSVNPRDAN